MAMWTSLVVLSLAVVSTLSFPHPDAEYKIPTVGLGARAQYYVLHDDGTYKFGYDTADGIYEQAMANAPGDVSGAFGYRDATGTDVKLEYTADERGFIARGSHLPTAPEADFGARLETDGQQPSVYASQVPVKQYSAPTVPATPVEVAQVRSSADEDGSYRFSYETARSSRSESADAHNNVQGHYAFVADDGINREINYIAGSDTGYIAEGDSLPIGPAVPGAESGIPTGRILPVLSEDEANKLAAETYTGDAPAVATYSASPGSATADTAFSSSDADASYSFNYDAGDSSRVESADANLNVQGTYSFVPPDHGHRLTVNYVAGSDTGFVAKGDHLPVAPDADFGSRVDIPSAPAPVPLTKTAATQHSIPAAHAPTPAVTPVEVAQIRSSADEDGSYRFSYETASSSRSESADTHNNVQGHYAFVADDGINREINYIAGSGTGYIAEGDSLPIGPAVPGAESGIPTGRILPVLSEEEANALAGSSVLLKSGEGTSVGSSDASYAFSFKSDSYSRREEADADGNIVGSFSFLDEYGQEHTVNFVAGRETGYQPEGYPTPEDIEIEAPSPVPVATYSVPQASDIQSPSSHQGATLVATHKATPAVSKIHQETASAVKYSAPYAAGHSSHIVGDVLLHQYSPSNPKHGYVFTAL